MLKHTILRLEEDLHHRLKVLAAKNNTTMTQLIAAAISEYVSKAEAK